MPSLKTGTHKLTLVLDTKSPLGELTAERTISVEDPAISKLAKDYIAARDADKTARACALQGKLLAARFSQRIRPGQEVSIDKPNNLDAVAPDDYSAHIKWYPEKDCLRAVVSVVDSSYAAPAKDEEDREYRAYVDIFVCASGADQDIYKVHLLQGDKEGKPYISSGSAGANQEGVKCPVKAAWKRTPTGYVVEAKIPWSALDGYEPGWKVLPVEAQVLNKVKGWSYYVMTKAGEPDKSAGSYSLLTRE